MKRAAFLGLSAAIGFASGLFLQVTWTTEAGVEVGCNAAWAEDNGCKVDSEGECSGHCSKGTYCQRRADKSCACAKRK